MKTPKTYILVDDRGETLGYVKHVGPGGTKVEYGFRDGEGVLHVEGMARIQPPSHYLHDRSIPEKTWDAA